MNNKDYLIQNLSSPIEQLGLDLRSFNVLKRAGVRTVSDIIRLGEENILRLRNVGPLVVDRVFSAVARYLNLSKEDLSNDEVVM